ncbi:hypothetical protein AYI68_g839 [Smittium mucronatum]|uniref:Uncharacterized protein n=1 Tax=Smittium mucronatum TaxID=133383 RepID=A0A1R0H7C0_9FUNG|nr:hypothetical protein AYI68_g839 [Smittium mucronatum]
MLASDAIITPKITSPNTNFPTSEHSSKDHRYHPYNRSLSPKRFVFSPQDEQPSSIHTKSTNFISPPIEKIPESLNPITVLNYPPDNLFPLAPKYEFEQQPKKNNRLLFFSKIKNMVQKRKFVDYKSKLPPNDTYNPPSVDLPITQNLQNSISLPSSSRYPAPLGNTNSPESQVLSPNPGFLKSSSEKPSTVSMNLSDGTGSTSPRHFYLGPFNQPPDFISTKIPSPEKKSFFSKIPLSKFRSNSSTNKISIDSLISPLFKPKNKELPNLSNYRKHTKPADFPEPTLDQDRKFIPKLSLSANFEYSPSAPNEDFIYSNDQRFGSIKPRRPSDPYSRFRYDIETSSTSNDSISLKSNDSSSNNLKMLPVNPESPKINPNLPNPPPHKNNLPPSNINSIINIYENLYNSQTSKNSKSKVSTQKSMQDDDSSIIGHPQNTDATPSSSQYKEINPINLGKSKFQPSGSPSYRAKGSEHNPPSSLDSNFLASQKRAYSESLNLNNYLTSEKTELTPNKHPQRYSIDQAITKSSSTSKSSRISGSFKEIAKIFTFSNNSRFSIINSNKPKPKKPLQPTNSRDNQPTPINTGPELSSTILNSENNNGKVIGRYHSSNSQNLDSPETNVYNGHDNSNFSSFNNQFDLEKTKKIYSDYLNSALKISTPPPLNNESPDTRPNISDFPNTKNLEKVYSYPQTLSVVDSSLFGTFRSSNSKNSAYSDTKPHPNKDESSEPYSQSSGTSNSQPSQTQPISISNSYPLHSTILAANDSSPQAYSSLPGPEQNSPSLENSPYYRKMDQELNEKVLQKKKSIPILVTTTNDHQQSIISSNTNLNVISLTENGVLIDPGESTDIITPYPKNESLFSSEPKGSNSDAPIRMSFYQFFNGPSSSKPNPDATTSGKSSSVNDKDRFTIDFRKLGPGKSSSVNVDNRDTIDSNNLTPIKSPLVNDDARFTVDPKKLNSRKSKNPSLDSIKSMISKASFRKSHKTKQDRSQSVDVPTYRPPNSFYFGLKKLKKQVADKISLTSSNVGPEPQVPHDYVLVNTRPKTQVSQKRLSALETNSFELKQNSNKFYENLIKQSNTSYLYQEATDKLNSLENLMSNADRLSNRISGDAYYSPISDSNESLYYQKVRIDQATFSILKDEIATANGTNQDLTTKTEGKDDKGVYFNNQIYAMSSQSPYIHSQEVSQDLASTLETFKALSANSSQKSVSKYQEDPNYKLDRDLKNGTSSYIKSFEKAPFPNMSPNSDTVVFENINNSSDRKSTLISSLTISPTVESSFVTQYRTPPSPTEPSSSRKFLNFLTNKPKSHSFPKPFNPIKSTLDERMLSRKSRLSNKLTPDDLSSLTSSGSRLESVSNSSIPIFRNKSNPELVSDKCNDINSESVPQKELNKPLQNIDPGSDSESCSDDSISSNGFSLNYSDIGSDPLTSSSLTSKSKVTSFYKSSEAPAAKTETKSIESLEHLSVASFSDKLELDFLNNSFKLEDLINFHKRINVEEYNSSPSSAFYSASSRLDQKEESNYPYKNRLQKLSNDPGASISSYQYKDSIIKAKLGDYNFYKPDDSDQEASFTDLKTRKRISNDFSNSNSRQSASNAAILELEIKGDKKISDSSRFNIVKVSPDPEIRHIGSFISPDGIIPRDQRRRGLDRTPRNSQTDPLFTMLSNTIGDHPIVKDSQENSKSPKNYSSFEDDHQLEIYIDDSSIHHIEDSIHHQNSQNQEIRFNDNVDFHQKLDKISKSPPSSSSQPDTRLILELEKNKGLNITPGPAINPQFSMKNFIDKSTQTSLIFDFGLKQSDPISVSNVGMGSGYQKPDRPSSLFSLSKTLFRSRPDDRGRSEPRVRGHKKSSSLTIGLVSSFGNSAASLINKLTGNSRPNNVQLTPESGGRSQNRVSFNLKQPKRYSLFSVTRNSLFKDKIPVTTNSQAKMGKPILKKPVSPNGIQYQMNKDLPDVPADEILYHDANSRADWYPESLSRGRVAGRYAPSPTSGNLASERPLESNTKEPEVASDSGYIKGSQADRDFNLTRMAVLEAQLFRSSQYYAH